MSISGESLSSVSSSRPKCMTVARCPSPQLPPKLPPLADDIGAATSKHVHYGTRKCDRCKLSVMTTLCIHKWQACDSVTTQTGTLSRQVSPLQCYHCTRTHANAANVTCVLGRWNMTVTSPACWVSASIPPVSSAKVCVTCGQTWPAHLGHSIFDILSLLNWVTGILTGDSIFSWCYLVRHCWSTQTHL